MRVMDALSEVQDLEQVAGYQVMLIKRVRWADVLRPHSQRSEVLRH